MNIDNIADQGQSIMATVCENAQLFAATPEPDETDPRDIWDEDDAIHAVHAAFQILADAIGTVGTQLADERESLLWGFVNMLDAQTQRLDRAADRLMPDLRDLQHQQDGSEIKSRELELRHRPRPEPQRPPRRLRTDCGTPWPRTTGPRPAASGGPGAAPTQARPASSPPPPSTPATSCAPAQTAKPRPTCPRVPSWPSPAARTSATRPRSAGASIKPGPSTPTWSSSMAAAPASSASPQAGPSSTASTRSSASPTGTATVGPLPFRRNDDLLNLLPKGLIAFPGSRHHRQPRRQGSPARHPRPEGRRLIRSPQGRVASAARPFFSPHPRKITNNARSSTPSLPATSPHPHGSPPSAPFAASHPLRLAPLAVGTPVPLPRRRCGLRPPPASTSPLLRCPHHRGRHYPRLRSLALLHTSFPNKAAWPMPHPSTPSLTATSLTLTARRLRRLCRPQPSASLRSPSAPPSRFRVAGAGFARLRLPASPPAPMSAPPPAPLPTPPVAGAPPHFLPQQGGMVHAPSFNPIPHCYIPHPHGSPPSAPLPPSTLRLAPLAVGAPVPLPRRRRGLRPPPASASPLLRCPHHRQGHCRRLRSLALPRTSFANKAAWSGPHPSTPSLPATSPHPHGSPPSAPLPLSPLPPRSARRRRLRPTSASPVRASPASGFRIPPAPMSTPPRAPLPTPPVAGAPSTLPSPTRRHGPGPILQPHPSLLHPLTRTARRLRRLRRPQPLRLAPLAVSAAVPLPRRRCGLRPPPASASPPCSDVRTTARATADPSGRSRSLRTSFANKAAWSGPYPSAPSLPAISPHPHGSPPSAPLPLSTPPPRSARRRLRRPASASPVPASPASGFRIPPCSDVRTTASATADPSGRSRSLRTSFANKAPWSGPYPSTPSLPVTSPHPHSSPPSAPLPPLNPFRLAPLAVSAAVPLPRRRCGLRPPPASASPPCSDVRTTASATTHASGRWRSSTLPSPTRRHGPCPILQPHPSLLHPPPSRLAAFGAFAALTPPPRSARRRRPRPASASPVRASPASGFRIPPAPMSAPPPAPLPTPPVARAPSALPSPTRRHGPGPILQPHPSLLHPLTRTARRLRRLCRLSTPPPRSARRRRHRPASASPARASPASGFRIPPCPGVRTTAGRHCRRLRQRASHDCRQLLQQ